MGKKKVALIGIGSMAGTLGLAVFVAWCIGIAAELWDNGEVFSDAGEDIEA